MDGDKLSGLSCGKNVKESLTTAVYPVVLTHGKQVAIWCGINIRWWQMTHFFRSKDMTQTQQFGRFECQHLVTNGSHMTACFTAWTFIHHRGILKNHRTQNTQHSKLGDRRWELRKKQVRGSDKDREPELQNSDSHFILRFPFFTILHSIIQKCILLILCSKSQNKECWESKWLKLWPEPKIWSSS